MAISKLQEEMLDDSKNICKAWANFNGTGTLAILDSYNVSSIDDLGAGDYRINFTQDMSDTNYVVNGTCSTGSFIEIGSTLSTTNVNTRTRGHDNVLVDENIILVTVFGN